MYDILGLAMPGLVLLFLLYQGAIATNLTPSLGDHWKSWSTLQVAAVILASYMLGYALQALSYLHFQLFDELGWWLLGKSVSGRLDDHGVAAAGKFTGRYFETTPFYKLAKNQIAEAVRLGSAEGLKFSDVQNLAFAIAGDAADKASNFQFRADLCGALSTLSLIAALAWTPLAAASNHVPRAWCVVVEGGMAVWLVIAVFVRFVGSEVWTRRWARYLWWVIPVGTVATAVALRLAHCYPAHWWIVPLLLSAWFAFLHRAFFYTDIRGRIIFHIALAEISRSSVPAQSS
jgi:hypothetical protein